MAQKVSSFNGAPVLVFLKKLKDNLSSKISRAAIIVTAVALIVAVFFVLTTKDSSLQNERLYFRNERGRLTTAMSSQEESASHLPEQIESMSQHESVLEQNIQQDDTISMEPKFIIVDVSGGVENPQVVTLPADARVNDAINAAGGLTADAERSLVNLASTLEDGMKIHVPIKGEEATASNFVAIQSQGTFNQENDGFKGLVNINTASREELITLPGIGEKTADVIIKDREKNGPFNTKEDLERVKGIGPAKLESVIDLITV